MSAIAVASPDLVQGLTTRIERLVSERQALRSAHAGREQLEGNRQEICRLQHELSLALVAHHRPAA
jgi:hypothetical protein